MKSGEGGWKGEWIGKGAKRRREKEGGIFVERRRKIEKGEILLGKILGMVFLDREDRFGN
jgi:hypothetical protein